MKKVFVCMPVSEEHKQWLKESVEAEFIFASPDQITDEELAEAWAIIGNLSPARLKACKDLKLMQLNSAGTDGYTAPGVMPQGAVLCNATGSYGLAISEHMLGMLLTLMKKLHLYRDQQKRNVWEDRGTVKSILGSTVLILGMGDIGGEFGKRVHALGARVIGITRTPGQKPDYADLVDTTENFKKYLPEADIIAMSLPGTPATYHIIDRDAFACMKPGAILLNVGRGTAIDQEALREALTSGTLGACGIDVTDPEPLPANSPLWQLDDLLITPHISGGFHLQETWDRIIRIAAKNLEALESGEPFTNIVDFATGYRKK